MVMAGVGWGELKDKDLSSRRKMTCYTQGTPSIVTADLSSESKIGRWSIQVLKAKSCQLRLLYLAQLSFRNEDKIKKLAGKRKLRRFIVGGPAKQDILRECLWARSTEPQTAIQVHTNSWTKSTSKVSIYLIIETVQLHISFFLT